jgi:hypothetical protein
MTIFQSRLLPLILFVALIGAALFGLHASAQGPQHGLDATPRAMASPSAPNPTETALGPSCAGLVTYSDEINAVQAAINREYPAMAQQVTEKTRHSVNYGLKELVQRTKAIVPPPWLRAYHTDVLAALTALQQMMQASIDGTDPSAADSAFNTAYAAKQQEAALLAQSCPAFKTYFPGSS